MRSWAIEEGRPIAEHPSGGLTRNQASDRGFGQTIPLEGRMPGCSALNAELG
jgi:hypothetical protein